jgi:hypothetical protein
MLLGIDHLVIAVHDPEAAAAELEAVAGFAWSGGGRHESMGTYNQLAFLGDTYLELIGVFDPRRVAANPSFAVGAAAWSALGAGREGLVTFALATDDVVADVARLQATGSRIGDPVPGARMRPDGEMVRWVTAFPALGPEAPFLIEHEREGAEWGDEARAARAAFRHPVGGRLRLAGLELPVADRRTAAAEQTSEVGLEFDGDGVAGIGDQWVRLRSTDGGAATADITAEPGTPELDVVRYGVRWRRRSSQPAGGRRSAARGGA